MLGVFQTLVAASLCWFLSSSLWIYAHSLSYFFDSAHEVRRLVDQPRHAEVERSMLVCDKLNPQTLALLFQAFPRDEAALIADKLEQAHTPKHGSWLGEAASELSVLTRHSADLWDLFRAVCQAVVEWSCSRAPCHGN
jgi:hypothetical protein